MSLFDFNHPSFKPLWVRVAVVGSCTAWALLELAWGNPFWAMLFGGLAAASFHGLFMVFEPRDRIEKTPEGKSDTKDNGKN